MGIEELCIKKIENNIRAIRLGTKNPREVDLDSTFDRLKTMNSGMYSDLMVKYINVVNDYVNRKIMRDKLGL
jgi:hypothetical protein